MTEEIRNYPRSHHEALADVRYHARLHQLHAALYRRLRMILSFISLLAGSAAFGSALHALPAWAAAVAGFLIAVLAIVDAVAGFSDKVYEHQALFRRFTDLAGRASLLTLEALDQASAEIEADAIGEIESLRLRAFNDSVISAGRPDYVEPLPLLGRVLSLIV